ncbi:N amino acid transport system protein [Lophiostoma macrostomum CBS 122681]|uniref:N amino acid transport system protein n=1 Tax=Lophiostoma macrostomum CBS 122681 TaxID=1314788 RepID=A0A6A6TA11_9PLEO|nr:N amino acid transport system protein [Lophiostoma macrostomum CBS 122681]
MSIFNIRDKREGSSSSAESETPSSQLPAVSHITKTDHAEPSSEPKNVTVVESERRLTQGSDPEGQVSERQADAFGNEEGAAIHYKTMDWWHCGVLMIAENVSLGVLALPQAVAWLGLVPGLLLIFFLGIIAGYTGFIIGQFKEAFPQVVSFADCGELIAGRIGKEIMAVSQVLILIFIMAAHVLSFAVAMNVMTDHSMCTVAFAALGLIICFVLGLPRTLKGVSYLSIFSCISVFVAVTVTMIAIAISKPDMGNFVAVHPDMPLVTGLTPVMNIILAYSGHVGFFSFAAELKNPRDYTKALVFMQTLAVTFYMVIGAVIYYYAGEHVASPALGSASPTVRKIAFGIALPTIVVAGVINGSVACKYIYIRIWYGTDVIHQKSFKSIGSWVGICAVAWFVSWVIAESIPNFNSLLALIGAVFGSWFSYGLPGGLWLYMNKGRMFSTPRKTALTLLTMCIFCLGATMCILGLWNSGHELSQGTAGQPFSCQNNWRPSIERSD